jgi:hypothetical protein
VEAGTELADAADDGAFDEAGAEAAEGETGAEEPPQAARTTAAAAVPDMPAARRKNERRETMLKSPSRCLSRAKCRYRLQQSVAGSQ